MYVIRWYTSLLAVLFFLLSASPVFAAKAKTVATPELQESIFRILGFGPTKTCPKPTLPKVRSSEVQADATFESGVLVSGEIWEVWQANHCGNKVRYLFRFAPVKSGALSIVGFERTK